MKTDIYNIKTKKVGNMDLPTSIFGLRLNNALLHQVVVSMQSNARIAVAHTKDRGDVRGGGRKPWKQKGTGRARHGSIRSPLWRGGGATFGPNKARNFRKSINKKMRLKALFVALSVKLKEGNILLLDDVSFSEPSANNAKVALKDLSKVKGFETLYTKRKNSAILVLPGIDTNVSKSFSNFGNIEVKNVKDLNVVDVLKYKYVIFVNPEKSVRILSERSGNTSSGNNSNNSVKDKDLIKVKK